MLHFHRMLPLRNMQWIYSSLTYILIIGSAVMYLASIVSQHDKHDPHQIAAFDLPHDHDQPQIPTNNSCLDGIRMNSKRKLTPLKKILVDNFNCCVVRAPMYGPPTQEYVAEMRNPCWYDKGRKLRCLPYFYLAGVSKSGTTDLSFR